MARVADERQSAGLDDKYGLFIGGDEIQGGQGDPLPVENPATGRVITEVAQATKSDVDRAVESARKAFRSWRDTTPSERADLLHSIADRIEENAERFALIETLEMGRPIQESRISIASTVDHYRYFAGAARHFEGKSETYGPDRLGLTHHEPLGVVGQIIPWNFPLLMAAWKLAPALAVGNCSVLKPAEQTPFSIIELMRTVGDCIPDGVVNVVNGPGKPTGEAVTEHPGVSKLAFTGSTETGCRILQASADNLIPVTLELGGKNPQVVFPDADYRQVLDGAALGIYSNQGQNCTAGSRLLVHESIHDELVDGLTRISESIRLGDPTREDTEMGPMAHREQWEKVLSYLELGREEGARLVTGGGAPDDPDLEGGYYVKPTIFDDVRPDMRIYREEIFGPVLCVTSFTDYDEAIQLANDTDYGLAAAVWTEDLNQAHRAVHDIDAGRVWVNHYHSYPNGMPFGGYKKSGIGRETARETLRHYTQTKSAIFDLSGTVSGRYRVDGVLDSSHD